MKMYFKRKMVRHLGFVLTFVLVLSQFIGFIVPAASIFAASNYVRLKNVWQNTYLYEDGDQVKYGLPSADDKASHWEVLTVGDGSVRIRNRASGDYMNIEHLKGYVECTGINSEWESARWVFEDENGQKFIQNRWQSSHYIHVENLLGYAQAGNIYKAWNSAKWLVETVSDTPGENPEPENPDPETPEPEDPDPETPDPDPEPEEPTPTPEGSNLAIGKSVTVSSTIHTFVGENANDGDVSTYWEGAGGSYPSTISIDLGANTDLTSIVLKLNPSNGWSARTQTIQVFGREQSSSNFESLAASKAYNFNPASGNQVTIPLSKRVSEVQLKITGNTGSSAGQIAEFEVYGTKAPNPDLIITDIQSAPVSPLETDDITLKATVKNTGTASAAATDVKFYLDSALAGTVNTPALTAGQSATVSLPVGPQNAGTYKITGKINEEHKLVELDYSNNSLTSKQSLVVSQVPSSDLVAVVSWNPGNPSAGDNVTFTVNLKNQGNIASAGGAHGMKVVLKNAAGSIVKEFNPSYNGVLAAGASVNVAAGTWTAVNGSYNLICTVAADANEALIKQQNNTAETNLYSGRGANMPFTVIEAESASNRTNGTKLAQNFIPGDYAGEASGRSAVYLSKNGEFVEFTLTSPANAFVLRSAVDEGTDSTISIYADGVDVGDFKVTSRFSHVYATPSTLGRLGYDNTGSKAYWLYEDSQLMLDKVYPTGTKIKIQKDASDVPFIYVDMLETENVAPAASNPDPARYVEVSASKSIDQALMEFRQDATKKGIFIPAGEWMMDSKIFLYGRAVEIVGAGPWHTRLVAPQTDSNKDVGFNIGSTANGTTIRDLSAWGNYIYRVDGPGKFIDGNGMQDVTVENVWAEHFVCLYWGVNSSNNTFKDCRIKNMFADGINMTNGSSNNLITNCYARGCGDDAFALFSATDAGGSYNVGNVYSNLSAVCTRRAACFAVYGGSDNIYQNLYGADTLTYPGITISSYSFGYNTLGFGDKDCIFDGVTLDRCGGDFWTSAGADDKINDYQNFGAIWVYCGDRAFQNIVVKNVDINEPVYFGIQVQTMYPQALSIKNVRFENININSPTRYGIKFCLMAEAGQGPCKGEASFKDVKINNPGIMSVYGLSKCPDFNAVKLGNGNNW